MLLIMALCFAPDTAFTADEIMQRVMENQRRFSRFR